jgi:hypothetical protein
MNQDHFQELIDHQAARSISILIPTQRAGRETRQNPIYFKNAVDRSAELLTQCGMNASDIQLYLEPLDKLVADRDFWQTQLDGLAVYLHNDLFKLIKVPYTLTKTVIVGDRFHIKPILPVFQDGDRFAYLILNRAQIQLMVGGRFGFTRIDFPDGTPISMDEALQYEDPERQMQAHSSSAPHARGQNITFHGHEASQEDQRNLMRFFQIIDKAIKSLLGSRGMPMILIGTDDMRGLYMKVSAYSGLLDRPVRINPGGCAPEELHQLAWEAFQPELDKDEQEKLARFQSLFGNGELATDLKTILEAAEQGRVNALLVPRKVAVWGSIEQGDFELFKDPDEKEREDLLNYAILHTLRTNGEVMLTEKEWIPGDDNVIAAELRY